MDAGNLGWLGGSDGRAVGGMVVVGAIVVVNQGAICYVVSSLTTLKAGVIPLAVVY